MKDNTRDFLARNPDAIYVTARFFQNPDRTAWYYELRIEPPDQPGRYVSRVVGHFATQALAEVHAYKEKRLFKADYLEGKL